MSQNRLANRIHIIGGYIGGTGAKRLATLLGAAKPLRLRANPLPHQNSNSKDSSVRLSDGRPDCSSRSRRMKHRYSRTVRYSLPASPKSLGTDCRIARKKKRCGHWELKA